MTILTRVRQQRGNVVGHVYEPTHLDILGRSVRILLHSLSYAERIRLMIAAPSTRTCREPTNIQFVRLHAHRHT